MGCSAIIIMHIFPFHDSALLSLVVNKIFTSFSQVFFPVLIVIVHCGKFENKMSDVWC